MISLPEMVFIQKPSTKTHKGTARYPYPHPKLFNVPNFMRRKTTYTNAMFFAGWKPRLHRYFNIITSVINTTVDC